MRERTQTKVNESLECDGVSFTITKEAAEEDAQRDTQQKSNACDMEEIGMMYPYMTLNDNTEITHSEMKEDGTVKVYIETPDETGGFRSAVCWLPGYRWEDIKGYTDAEMTFFKELVRDNAHLMLEFSQDGGILCTTGV